MAFTFIDHVVYCGNRVKYDSLLKTAIKYGKVPAEVLQYQTFQDEIKHIDALCQDEVKKRGAFFICVPFDGE